MICVNLQRKSFIMLKLNHTYYNIRLIRMNIASYIANMLNLSSKSRNNHLSAKCWQQFFLKFKSVHADEIELMNIDSLLTITEEYDFSLVF